MTELQQVRYGQVAAPTANWTAEEVRHHFPILARKVHGKPLIYLDNAATSQKPRMVLEALNQYYKRHNANVHRGVHTLAAEATQAFEVARAKVARFINAPSPEQVIFTRGTTEAINLVAYAWGLENLRSGDEIVVTEMEHHSNLVPWHLAARRTGATIKAIPITIDGKLDLDQARQLIGPKTRLVAVAHVSNVLGTINPIEELTALAHARGALVLVDGAQAVPHMPVDVPAMGADFYAFSSHKMCGPTGAGVLYGRRELLEAMPPFLGGGEMISEVYIDRSTYNVLPYKFEAGTPNIAQAIGLGAGVDYLSALGMERIHQVERELVAYAYERMRQVEGLQLYGPGPSERAGLVAFNLPGVHPHDLATFLDQDGIAIRAGHHCAQPLMRALKVQSTARASFYFYNAADEVDALVASLQRAKEYFGHVLG
ncbi:MAG: cysteine desulfurase [Deinococcus sp.]|nr:cysteine desulfurase [Deinococcus sp.]